MYTVVVHEEPGPFLDQAGPWLMQREDLHNLILSLAGDRARSGSWETGALFAVVTAEGEVVGCAVRTPPHKVLLTEMPVEAVPMLVEALRSRYGEIPGAMGPTPVASAVADGWTRSRGGSWELGMENGIYRLDSVIAPRGVSGRIRPAAAGDLDLAITWGEGFSRDAGVAFPRARDAVERWIVEKRLHVWEDSGQPVSIAVVQGMTERGCRIGYVYTPPDRRGNGYASGIVAALSGKMLDAGRRFCVLYTDLSNPTSNAIYRRLGYHLIAEVRDCVVVEHGGPRRARSDR